jgi:iron(III) transport system substrate-binding protein
MYKIKLPLMASVLAVVLSTSALAAEVNVYSARKEALIKPLLDKFSAETGIKTNLITAKADKLLTRMINEGRNTPVDLFITVDAGRLHRAKEADLLQPINNSTIEKTVPAHLRDSDQYWVGLSQRARVIFYAKDRVNPAELSTYEDLANSKWQKRICIRGSGNIYNQSLVASMIAVNGQAEALKWANALVGNFARDPKGGDRDQIKAAAAGQCDLAIANTYYYGKMLSSKKDDGQVAAANKMGVFWPNQSDRGVHVNISGAGISKYSKNKENAIKLLEYLLSDEAQSWYASVNYEYPVSQSAKISGLVAQWGDFKADTLNLSRLGQFNSDAVKTMDKASWK